MKVLVLGASGMAGHVISLYLKEEGYQVIAFSRSDCRYLENIRGDASNFPFLKKIIKEGNYDGIINAIGILNKKAEKNKAQAVLINSYLPHFLEKITRDTKTKIIHLSTDCVFSGNKGNYLENDLRDGSTFYDRTKALGELEDDKNLTFRNSIIGPDININGIGLFNWFMKQEDDLYGYSRAIWTGVTSITLAKAIKRALEKNLSGLYHLVNNQSISKYDLLVLFNKHIRKDKINIIPDKMFVQDKSLINTREDFSFKVASYEQMVIEMKDWIESHKDLYPHYFRT